MITLALLAAISAAPGAHWTCFAERWYSATTHLTLRAEILENGERGDKLFAIQYSGGPVPRPTQSMVWWAIPPEATRLWKPDEIRIEVTAKKVDREGHVSLAWAGGSQEIGADPETVVTYAGTAEDELVLRHPVLLALLWRQAGWTARINDRTGRKLGAATSSLPAEADIQPLFAAMNAEVGAMTDDLAHRCTTTGWPGPKPSPNR